MTHYWGGGGGGCWPRQILSNFWRLEQLFPILATLSNFWLSEQLLSNFILIYLIRITKINMWLKF